MKKLIKISALAVLTMLLNGCASGYNKIEPENINYGSKTIEGNILLEYKYDLLEKKYKKKETENNIKLIAVKLTNNSEKDIVLGINFKFVYEGGSDVRLMETENLYSAIKQSPASYLLYLLLTPMQLNTTTTSNGRTQTTSSIPIGYGVGPGLAGGNMLAASNANKNLKNDLMQYDIMRKTIKKGETVFGLIGVNSNSYDSIKVKLL